MSNTEIKNNAMEKQDKRLAHKLSYAQYSSLLYNADCEEFIGEIESNSIDAIITDPPYGYLKDQKLERPFNEEELFSKFKRVLKPSGFVIIFGRGTSFYRWNTILDDLGFKFKEEVIWDKSYVTSPVLPIARRHETIAIFTKKTGKIQAVKRPYTESKSDNVTGIIQDIKRLKSVLNNEKSLQYVLDYLSGVRSDFEVKRDHNWKATCQTKSTGKQEVSSIMSIKEGMKVQSIINVKRDHYQTVHPTQKPLKLLEYLIKMTTREGDTILDPFAGSFSTGLASYYNNRNCIGCEIDREYYDNAVERMNNCKGLF